MSQFVFKRIDCKGDIPVLEVIQGGSPLAYNCGTLIEGETVRDLIEKVCQCHTGYQLLVRDGDKCKVVYSPTHKWAGGNEFANLYCNFRQLRKETNETQKLPL